MANTEQKYKKLPGSKKGFLFGKYTLWQGSDHLLHIFSRFGVEGYKRFYFSDIQAIITRKTVVGKVLNGILAGLILLFLLPVHLIEGHGSLFFLALAAVILLLLLINLYRGPTCQTKLLTAVQTEKLHSLHRLKNTGNIMDRLGPLIRQTQGSLKPGDLNHIAPGHGGRRSSTRAGQSKTSVANSPRRDDGRAHMILFSILVVNAVLVASEFFISHVVTTILNSVSGLCLGIFIIMALVKQHKSSLPGSLQVITWCSLGFIGINFLAGYIVGMVFAINHNTGFGFNHWEIIKSISSFSPWDSPLKLGYNIFVLGGASFLGIAGLIILRRPAIRKIRPAPVMPPAAGQMTTTRTPLSV